MAPRFWAEEGSLYYSHMRHVGFRGALLTVFNGNYQLLTNLVAEIAARVPERFAAHVTTYAGLVVACGCCWMLANVLLSRGASLKVACAGAAMFALQPAGYEVFLNATNLQWVTSVVALLLCLSEDVPAASSRALLRYAALAVCGLNGTTACIILPVFLISALANRSGFRWGMALVLGLCTVIELAIIVDHHDQIHRPFALQVHSPLAAVFQVLLSLFVPGHLLDLAGNGMADTSGMGNAAALQVVLLGLVGLAILAVGASHRLGRLTVSLIVLALLGATAINSFGAQAPADVMLSGWAGARYFFIGGSCTVMLLASCMDSRSMEGRFGAKALALLVICNGALTATFETWPTQYLVGPSITEQIDGCKDEDGCRIYSWPPNGSFMVNMSRHDDAP